MICLPVGPRCDLCDLSTTGLCPSAKKIPKSKGRKAALAVSTVPESGSLPAIEIELEADEGSPLTASVD